jgi:hypothetical protein
LIEEIPAAAVIAIRCRKLTRCATRATRTPSSSDQHTSPSQPSRYDGIIHDFMLLNALSETRATRAAIDQATAFLRAGLGTG